MTLRRRSSVPFTAWVSGVCTGCHGHVSINTNDLHRVSGMLTTPTPHYCSDCRNMMKEPDNDKE